MKLQPRLSKEEAQSIAESIYSESKSCGIQWPILLSIAFTESSLNKSAVGLLNKKTKDFGLMQINIVNAKKMKLSTARLLSDTAYNVKAACKILVGIKKSHGSKPNWIGAYRAGTAFNKPYVAKIAKSYHNIIVKRASRIYYDVK